MLKSGITLVRRNLATTAILRAPSSAKSYIVQVVTKQPGQAVSFGETVAILTTSNSPSAEALPLTAPVNGAMLRLVARPGDTVDPNAEFAVFEGRKPMIEFRHLKGLQQQTTHASKAQATSTTAAQSSTPASSTTVASNKTTSSSTSKSFLDLPPNFGRLPPLTAREENLLHSGGAYE